MPQSYTRDDKTDADQNNNSNLSGRWLDKADAREILFGLSIRPRKFLYLYKSGLTVTFHRLVNQFTCPRELSQLSMI